MIIRNPRFLAAAFGLLMWHLCAADNSYRVVVQVDRDGTRTVDAVADVEAGFDADLQMSGANSAVQARVIARVTPLPSANDVAVALRYFEKRGGDWVLLGEPGLVTSLGSDVGVEFSDNRTDDRYVLKARVTDRRN